ncbi:MAG: O-acetylhomoserine aminocarboxypropyltransferase/cysteine synthase [Paludibacteraceae bacterium]|nr:O-acetylhomoserine aminocarboxypropyltransferase/cysteine synthase [Paludibacteraceae bacterium]
MSNKLHIGTLCVQAGYEPQNGESRQLPIVQSTTFKYTNAEQMAALFDLDAEGYFYTRLANPTNDHVAAKIAALEGGVGAMLTSSGQAANFYACFNIAQAGDHIVSASGIYGGTFNLLGNTLRKMGIEVTFVDQAASEEELNRAFRPNTKLVFGESLGNPSMRVLDIQKFARIAHAHGVPLIVDNTFPTPVHLRPLEWGADIVTHSTTKYMDGHGVAVGGVIVDGGTFDWEAHHDRFACLTEPDDTYHGLVYTQKFGRKAFIVKATAQLMRDFGSIQSPQNAFYLNLGLQSLHVRMRQHCASAEQIARFLENHEQVAWVTYPSLDSHPDKALADKYLPDGSCGVISFGLKGGREAAMKLIPLLQLATVETHVADCYTCVLHPASHTHRQMTDEQLIAAGAAPDLIRLSIGLEDTEDLLADLEAALAQL